jgi:hypothetical protein
MPVNKLPIPPNILPKYPGLTCPALGPDVYVSVYPYLLAPLKRLPKNPRSPVYFCKGPYVALAMFALSLIFLPVSSTKISSLCFFLLFVMQLFDLLFVYQNLYHFD